MSINVNILYEIKFQNKPRHYKIDDWYNLRGNCLKLGKGSRRYNFSKLHSRCIHEIHSNILQHDVPQYL